MWLLAIHRGGIRLDSHHTRGRMGLRLLETDLYNSNSNSNTTKDRQLVDLRLLGIGLANSNSRMCQHR